MNDAEQVFAFLAAEPGATALVTVTGVNGSSTRNPGAHMAVAGDGRFAGSLSGGCIEAAVVSEATAAIAAGQPRRVRFGQGSPFIDIRLPCGGGIDLLITPLPDARFAAQVTAAFAARQPFVIELADDGRVPVVRAGSPEWRTLSAPGSFSVAHLPALRIVIAGHGAGVEQLVAQAGAYGARTRVLTPDRALAARLEGASEVLLLSTASDTAGLEADDWTAVAFLFHDHEWEPALMRRALASRAFYIGAMGSRVTHQARLAQLARAGVQGAVARVRAPIGLIASSRDPQVLALSALAEIVRDHQAVFDRPDRVEPESAARATAAQASG